MKSHFTCGLLPHFGGEFYVILKYTSFMIHKVCRCFLVNSLNRTPIFLIGMWSG